MQSVKLAFVVTSCLAIRPAAAQPAPAVPPSQSVLPDVLSTAAGTTLEARIDYTRLDSGAGLSDLTVFAANLHLQYIAPAGPGGYLSLPMAYARVDSSDGGRASLTELGNAELGGLYVFRNQNLDAYVRGGLSLRQTNTDEGPFLVPLANFVPRLADAAVTGLGVSWVRAGAGVRMTNGSLVLGASGGVDYPFGPEGDLVQPNGLVHLSGSIGVTQPTFALAAGATMYQSISDMEGDNNTITVQTVGDVPIGGKARVYGALAFSPEDGLDAFSIGVGVRVSM